MKKAKMITGKLDLPQEKSLGEIAYGHKESKFSKFSTREDYRHYLYSLGHIEICEELLRLNSYPSTDKSICLERCLSVYDRVHAAKKIMPVIKKTKSNNLEDLMK